MAQLFITEQRTKHKPGTILARHKTCTGTQQLDIAIHYPLECLGSRATQTQRERLAEVLEPELNTQRSTDKPTQIQGQNPNK